MAAVSPDPTLEMSLRIRRELPRIPPVTSAGGSVGQTPPIQASFWGIDDGPSKPGVPSSSLGGRANILKGLRGIKSQPVSSQ